MSTWKLHISSSSLDLKIIHYNDDSICQLTIRLTLIDYIIILPLDSSVYLRTWYIQWYIYISLYVKMHNWGYVKIFPKLNIKIIVRVKIDTPYT